MQKSATSGWPKKEAYRKFKMLDLYGLSNLFATVTNLGIAFLVYTKGRDSKLARIWAVFTLCVAIYGFGGFMASGAKDYDSAFFWWRFAYIGVILLPAIFTCFVYTFLEIRRSILVNVVYFVTALIWLANIFSKSLFIGHVSLVFTDSKWFTPAWFVYPPGPLHIFHTVVLYFILLTYLFVRLVLAYKNSDPLKRTQIKYFTIAMILGFYGGGSSYLPCFGINIYPIPNITVPLYTFLIAYAIIRHQLMDIEVIIKRTLVFAGLLASVFTILILPTLLIQEYVLRAAGTGSRMIGLTISGIIIILTMRRIDNFLVNITDKYLFQKKYNYKELLKTFTAEVLTVLELDKLVNLTIDKLTEIVKMKSAAVLLFDDVKQQFDVVASQGIKDSSVTLVRPDGIVTFMDETHGYVLVSELREKNISIPDSIQEIITKLNAELIIPMVLHEEVIGVLSLGKKKSDENYTQDDLDILLPLAKTLAIAISNAELFVELGKTQAEAAQREKMAVIGTLSAGINHEICNPLGIARGQCEAFLLNLKDGLYKSKTNEELIEKAKEIMAKVIKETDRATAITKKLSGFAKPSKGEAEIVRIDKELDEVFGLVGYELKLEKIEFCKDIQMDIPDLFVDKKQFQEILFNLIRNAGQAIGEKGRITITAKEENENVFIDVQDTGSGISEDRVKQLFNPFFTTKDPGKGTGLGLFIVRQIIEKNGGKIYLKETKVGEGTTFRLEFPVTAREGAKVAR